MNLLIREYQVIDHASCRDLWKELTQRHRDIYSDPSIGGEDPGVFFEHYLESENLAGLWVAEQDGMVVGMAGLLMEAEEAEIEPVVVRSGFRSQGIGTHLIEKLKSEARKRGARYLSIRPVARNVEAIQCFYRSGFSILGKIELFMDLTGATNDGWKDGITIHEQLFRY